MTRTSYHVMTQTDGSSPRFEAAFSHRDEAIDLIRSLGGDESDTALVPIQDEDAGDTLVYNLGREPGCAIAWIGELIHPD